MTVLNGVKQQIIDELEVLPVDVLPDVMTFLEYLQYRLSPQAAQQTPYVPVAFGGLWAGVTITDQDIAEVRQEMWADFGESAE